MNTITPTRRRGNPPAVSPAVSPRAAAPRWLAWPRDRVPTAINSFLVAQGASGKCIAVGRVADGSYVAFDANCYHHGDPLWTDDFAKSGDIEDGAVVCPGHGRRIDVVSGACLDEPVPRRRQRTYATRSRAADDGVGVVVEVDVARYEDLDSDRYNSGLSPAVARSRAARASVTPERPARPVGRRLSYEEEEDDDDDDQMRD